MTTHNCWTLRRATAIVAMSIATSLVLDVAPAIAQRINVKAATPSAGEQGSVDLQVAIAGSGFGPGAQARFVLSGTDNPDGIRVKNTQYVSSSQLVATIDIDDASSLAYFDIKVLLSGRSGKGTDLFQVIEKVTGQPRVCPPPALDPLFQVVGTLNVPTPTGARFSPSLGISTAVGRATLAFGAGSREVLLLGVGTAKTETANGSLEIFFIDPVSGAVLDGSSLSTGAPPQPHLSLAMPGGVGAGKLAVGDVNGDGLADFVAAPHSAMENVVVLFISARDPAGVVSYTTEPIAPSTGDLNFGAGLATGDINADGRDEIIVVDGYACCASGKQARRPSLNIFSVSGGTPVLLQRVVPSSGDVSALATYGRHLAVGDVSGDGLNDVVVSNDSWGDGKLASAGAVMVHRGTGSGPGWISSNAIALLEASPGRDRQFGASVLVGNLGNAGSGALDVLGITKLEPMAEVFRGPLIAAGQTPDPVLRPSIIPGWRRGWWTRPPGLGDINGDGLADVVFGAPHAPDDTTCQATGAVQVLLAVGSSASGTTGWQTYLMTSPDAALAAFGWSVAVAPGSPFIFVAEKDREVGGVAGAGQIYIYRVVP